MKADVKKPGGMGLVALFSLSVGTIIGIGWITLLGIWLKDGGSVGAVLAFLLGGIIILPVVYCYGEATSLAPEAGGEVAFVRLAGGPKAALAVGWLLLLVFLSVVAFEAISVAWVLGVLFPPMLGPVVYEAFGSPVHLGGLLVGLAGAIAIPAMHLRGVGGVEGLQNFATIAKLVVSVVFIVAGLAFGEPENLKPYFGGSPETGPLVGFLSVLSITPLFYAGFNAMTQAVNERDPRISLRQVGYVLIASILVSILFYCGVLAAAAMAAPRAVLFASDLPAAAAFENAFSSPWMSRLVLISGLLGLISAWNATFFASTRILRVLADYAVLPQWFAKTDDKTGALKNAIAFCAVFGVTGAVLGKNAVGPIVSTSAVALIIVFVMASWAALRLRKTMPDAPRSFSMPGGAHMARLGVLVSLFLLFIAAVKPALEAKGAPVELMVLAAWCVLGLLLGSLSKRGAAAVQETL